MYTCSYGRLSVWCALDVSDINVYRVNTAPSCHGHFVYCNNLQVDSTEVGPDRVVHPLPINKYAYGNSHAYLACSAAFPLSCLCGVAACCIRIPKMWPSIPTKDYISFLFLSFLHYTHQRQNLRSFFIVNVHLKIHIKDHIFYGVWLEEPSFLRVEGARGIMEKVSEK